ncbi:MAG: glycosyltransferase [Pseudomonadota bacterium]
MFRHREAKDVQSASAVPQRPQFDPARPTPATEAEAVADWLLAQGRLTKPALNDARFRINRADGTLLDQLRHRDGIRETDIADAIAGLSGAERLMLDEDPDAELLDIFGASRAIKTEIMPWRRKGAVTLIAASSLSAFEAHHRELEGLFGPVRCAIATRSDIWRAVQSVRRRALVRLAETRVPDDVSCRRWGQIPRRGLWIVLAITVVALALAYPRVSATALTIWAVGTLFLVTGLRTVAALAAMRHDRAPTRPTTVVARLPKVSILVPLFHEKEIAGSLVRRLMRLDYPRELLEILLITEEDDQITRRVLTATRLPGHFRTITVPRGILRTKPRALNYALDFCRGSIVGVYDAEDAPSPDQIRRIVQRFADSPPDVACLQGVLEFYNAKTNWLSRCFALDYAVWFRLVLPGLARLGLVLPLGGTSVFFRREVLERLGGWDAYNVTEDADLGLRLARHGYRTELVSTVTAEEANCHVWPWIKQRSRWLKGYAMTYGVHMRRPRALRSDLGFKRFWGVQVLFLCTLSQFVLAPVLWSFWIVPLGGTHFIASHLSGPMFWTAAVLFLFAEASNLGIAVIGARRAGKPGLAWWVPLLHIYFPLGALASYKALYELVAAPFYWDKTSHGIYQPRPDQPARPSASWRRRRS